MITPYIQELLDHIQNSHKEQNYKKNQEGYKTYKIVPKVAEQIYIKNHGQNDITHLDEAVDCYLDNKGVGIKTFICNGKNSKTETEKIGEFGKYIHEYVNLEGLDKVKKIIELHNNRIISSNTKYNLINNKYHCMIINQAKEELIINEYDLDIIDSSRLILLGINKSIFFTDGNNNYSFYMAKNTLFRKFPIKLTTSKIFPINNIKQNYKLSWMLKYIKG